MTLAPMGTIAVRDPRAAAPAPALVTFDAGAIVRAPSFGPALDAARGVAGAERATFAVVRDGRVAWAGSSGAGTSAATPLVIGSVTKTFVAAAVLQLVAAGRIGLDDEVGAVLPAYPNVPPDVTVRQLLDHTSGIADVFNPVTSAALEADPAAAWTATRLFGTIQAPWHPPDAGWSYANANYYLLGLLVERLGREQLADALGRRFFGPLGLGATRVLTPADPGVLSAGWATIFWASGAMESSAADLARWGDALFAGDVLEPEMRSAMLAFNDAGYGLGVQRLELAGVRGIGHTGLLDTYTALLLHLPEDGVTIALLVDQPEAPLAAMLTARPAGGGPSLLDLALSES
jgi:D-alanyl-D-alanine carboxypeptidase